MTKQEELIKCFKTLYRDPSYQKMANLLSIQKTRIFRICNGHEMKLSEYLQMQKLVDDKKQTSELETIVGDCLVNLSEKSIREITRICKRKLENHHLINSPVQINLTASFAS